MYPTVKRHQYPKLSRMSEIVEVSELIDAEMTTANGLMRILQEGGSRRLRVAKSDISTTSTGVTWLHSSVERVSGRCTLTRARLPYPDASVQQLYKRRNPQ